MDIPLSQIIKYLSRRKTEIDELMLTLSQHDFALAEKIGHQIKGNAITFGFASLGVIGLNLETAAKAQDLKQCLTIVKEIEQFIATEMAKYS